MLRHLSRHLLAVFLAVSAYQLGRRMSSGDVDLARSRGERVWDLERTLHLPNEQALQALVLRSDDLTRLANAYYWLHWPLTAAVLVWLFVRHRLHYVWLASALGLSMAGALVLHLAVPTAPPRLLEDHGIVDTATVHGQSLYDDPERVGYTGQLLALPSLHAGWAVLIAVVLVCATTSRYRWLWLLHPVLTVLAIVVTGNHYWADAVCGIALCVGTLWLALRVIIARTDLAPARSPAGLPS